MKQKRQLWLATVLMLVFALTRWPGLLPLNFSAAYALAFCAGIYFPKRLAWWLPLGTLLVSDLALNCYYQFVVHVDAFKWTVLINYFAYASLLWLGSRFDPKAAFLKVVSGGIVGAILFYLITNIGAWFFNPFGNPEYTKTLHGLLVALTKGTAGYPQTWEFFRNTLFSGGLFTALFAAAMKIGEATEPEPKEETEEAGEQAEQPQETEA